MSQWWVRRWRSAVVIFGSPNTLSQLAESEVGGHDVSISTIAPASVPPKIV